MRFLHLSDLHLGRRLQDVSLLEDQQYILQQILDLVGDRMPDAVLIAGDVYDKAVPSAEAVRLLDWFLTELAKRDIPVLMVSGNHDSAERLSFGAQLLSNSKVFVSSVFEGPEAPLTLYDEVGEVLVYMLPFIKPVHVRRVFPEAEAADYTEAVRAVIDAWNPDPAKRNVLIAHQFVSGGLRSESEAISIGGLDDVSGEILDVFDYVALGHLHRAQSVGRETIRYCGTPLAYSFSEGDRVKTVTWVEMEEKGTVRIEQTELVPLRAVETVKGSFEQILRGESEKYLRIILTDDQDIPNALTRLRYRYPNLLRLEYDNMRTRMLDQMETIAEETVSPIRLLEDFYEFRNGRAMDEEQRKLSLAWMEEIWEEET